MKSLISEIIKFQLIGEVLSEGRIEDAKAKFPQDTDVIDYFASQDPSGNNKYLPWEMKIYKELPPNAPPELKERHKELIVKLIKGFHQHSQRLQVKDINQYKTLADLNTVVAPLIKAAEEKAANKLQQEEGVSKIYEDANWLLLRPLTHETSCKYGAHTQWCVASRDTSQHFKSYTAEGLLIFLIHKKSDNKFAFYTDEEIMGGGTLDTVFEIYNPIDDDISFDFGIDGSVRNFFKGLVAGKMGDYLNTEGYDEDGESEYEIRYEGHHGPRMEWAYDESDLVEELIDITLDYFLGAGSGRNSLEKYKNVYRIFGLTIDIKGKTQNNPFTIKDENGEVILNSETLKDKNFNLYARRNGMNDYLHDYIYDIWADEIMDDMNFIHWLMEKVKKGGLNFEITGPGFTEEVKKEKVVDKKNVVMTTGEANSILTAFDAYLKKVGELIKKEKEEKIDKVMNDIKYDRLKDVSMCFNFDSMMKNINSLPTVKSTVIQILRNRGLLKGRLPRNFNPYNYNLASINNHHGGNRHLTNVCITSMYEVRHISEVPVMTNKGLKNLGWLYNRLYENGVRLNNGYSEVVQYMMDYQKRKNP